MDSLGYPGWTATGAIRAALPSPGQSYGAPGCALKRLFLKE
jgi:hypothetical protein